MIRIRFRVTELKIGFRVPGVVAENFVNAFSVKK